MIEHVVAALPKTRTSFISANRDLQTYAKYGVVIKDSDSGLKGNSPLVGILSALGLLLLALKAGGRKTIGHDIFVDVMITITLMVCFYGTFSGMAAAMVGGLVASIVLFIMKKTMTHEKLTVEKKQIKVGNKFKIYKPIVSWKTIEPDWRK